MRNTESRQDSNRRAVLIAGASAAILVFAASRTALAAVAPGLPERQSIEIARALRPIPDQEWQTIAGDRVSQRYTIIRGDTLFDISQRLFGDARYWPKIWALNNNQITNPHWISPGKEIAFLPGTGVSLPSVAIGSDERLPVALQTPSGSLTLAPRVQKEGPSPIRAGRSDEWKRLPNQHWELLNLKLPPDVDPLGFDQRTRINFGREKAGFELPALVQSERIDFLGEITGGREEAKLLSTGDQVFIRSEGTLQVGETYALTDDPIALKADLFGRTGYSYILLGSVKITGVKDQVFIGSITSTRHPIARGAQLIVLPSRVRVPDPVPGPGPMEATLLIDKRFSSYVAAQHKQVFIDRGTDDGIQPGMVFRLFQYHDPSTREFISESGLIRNGDIMVIQVSPRFSSGIVISSNTTLPDKAKVTLLTDISEVFTKAAGGGKDVFLDEAAPTDSDIDTLEQLDGGAGLGKGEARELRQLEEWQEGLPPQEPTPEAVPPPPVPEEPFDEIAPEPEAPIIEPEVLDEVPPFEEVPPSEEEDLPPPPPPTAPDNSSDEFPPPPPAE